jgi:hypothetical protein
MAKKQKRQESNRARDKGSRQSKAVRPQADQKVLVAAPLPGNAKGNTPFVLLFAEQKSKDVLKEAGCVFNELVDGLSIVGAGDSPCTTFGGATAGDGYDSASSLA